MTPRESVQRLSTFVQRLDADGVAGARDWSTWRKDDTNAAYMADCFAYVRSDKMPSITNLMTPDFHSELPLVLLNYTKVAHATLHQFANGWVPPLRFCRGTIFDRKGELVAFPFPKFFNHGDANIVRPRPAGALEATMKEDGHLAIIFQYANRLLATTRGKFNSKSAQLANQLLEGKRTQIKRNLPTWITLLAELIHPNTHVIVDYGDRVEFRVNGAYDLRTLTDLPYAQLRAQAAAVGFPVVDLLPFTSEEQVLEYARHPEYRNVEGIVVRWPDGEREKYKCMPYVSRMIGGKLDHAYIITQLVNGVFDEKFADLDGEVQVQANELKAELMQVTTVTGGKKACWEFLYGLLPAEERTAYKKGICRKFYNLLVTSGQLVETATVVPLKAKRTRRQSAA